MRLAIIIFLFCACGLRAQDKLYFVNGTMSEGTVMSMGSEIVYFRVSDTSAVQKILKTQLLMIEDYKGTRHIFGANATPVRNKHTGVSEGPRNMLGIQPIEIFFGRFTAVYER